MKRKTGFTLVELLVVIAIISVLATLLLPTLDQAIFQTRVTACMNTQKQNYLASYQYSDDFRGWLPPNSFRVTNGPSFISYWEYVDQRFYGLGRVWALGYLPDRECLIDPDYVCQITPQTSAKNAGLQIFRNGKCDWSRIDRWSTLVAKREAQASYGLRCRRISPKLKQSILLCAIGGTVDRPDYDLFGAHRNQVANAGYPDGRVKSLDEKNYLLQYAKYASHPLSTNSWSVNLADLQCWWGYKSPWTWADEEGLKK